jgi:hypothetical protein
MPDFVVFAGEKCLNTYLDERVTGDDDDIEAAEPFLKVMRSALCNEDGDLGLTEMLAEIAGAEMVSRMLWTFIERSLRGGHIMSREADKAAATMSPTPRRT